MTTLRPETVTNTRVYVVDDDEPVRASLCALLAAYKYDAVASATAEEFLETFEPHDALCAFIDLRMPGMGGMELQRLLSERGIAVPIIILTAHGDVPLAVEAMKRGAIDFIEKPASESQLLSAIEAAGHHVANRLRTPCAAHRTRAGGAELPCPRHDQQAHSRRTRHQPANGGDPQVSNPREAGSPQPGGPDPDDALSRGLPASRRPEQA
jgi:FixJ family two-component response regulator